MKKSSNKFVVLLVIIAAIVSCSLAWSTAYPSGTWRYKITVNVDTPEGIKTGSAVREVTISRGIELTPETTPNKKSKGEAVVVDLGKRGVIFLLTGFGDYHKVFNAFPFKGGGTTAEGIEYYSHLKNAKAELDQSEYQLVTFTDINDATSVKAVVPKKTTESDADSGNGVLSFSEAFGAGVELKNVIIEMTDEPVTSGIVDKYLPWLQEYYNRRLDGQRHGTIKTKNKLANSLSAGSFLSGR